MGSMSTWTGVPQILSLIHMGGQIRLGLPLVPPGRAAQLPLAPVPRLRQPPLLGLRTVGAHTVPGRGLGGGLGRLRPAALELRPPCRPAPRLAEQTQIGRALVDGPVRMFRAAGGGCARADGLVQEVEGPAQVGLDLVQPRVRGVGGERFPLFPEKPERTAESGELGVVHASQLPTDAPRLSRRTAGCRRRPGRRRRTGRAPRDPGPGSACRAAASPGRRCRPRRSGP